MNRPQFIYKYYTVNEYTLDALRNHYFWFCDIEKLNDPLDSKFIHSEKYLKKRGLPVEMNEQLTKMFLWGVCSFTTKNNNMLMWSHYANSHKGICVEYNVSKDNLLSNKLSPIIYSNKKPIINDDEDIIKKGLLRKTKKWHYEEEWRLISGADIKMEYSPDALVKIYFGANLEEIDKQKIIDSVNTLTDIKFARAKINVVLQRIDFDLDIH